MNRIYAVIALIFVFSLASFADIRPPDQPTPQPSATPKEEKTTEARMTIWLDSNATEATLIIQRDKLKQLRAELDEIENDGNTNAAISDSNGIFLRTQTIIGGVFLSLAFVFGGVWFARTRKPDAKINKTMSAGAILLLVGFAATFVFANAGPPPALRNISGRLFNKETFRYWNRASGNIKIKVSDEVYGVELIVPDKKDKKDKEE